MSDPRMLISAMAEKCLEIIQKSPKADHGLLPGLEQPHLLEMCDRLRARTDEWPLTRLHRWLGYLQAGLIANRMIDLAGAKRMFDTVKNAFGAVEDDPNFVDHLDDENPFEMDLGGQG